MRRFCIKQAELAPRDLHELLLPVGCADFQKHGAVQPRASSNMVPAEERCSKRCSDSESQGLGSQEIGMPFETPFRTPFWGLFPGVWEAGPGRGFLGFL